MLNSIFAPCPSGHNPECFRLFEAMEAGCIPVAVMDAATQQSFEPVSICVKKSEEEEETTLKWVEHDATMVHA